MSTTIDPKKFGLTSRTILKARKSNGIAIVVDRKSRIIMADGKKILEKVNKIKRHNDKIDVSLETSAPVCSKTLKFLSENSIKVIIQD